MAKEFQERLQARAREALTQAIPFLEDPAHVEDVINFLMGGDRKPWVMETMENRPVDRLVHRVIFDIHYHIPNGRYLVEFDKDVKSLESLIKTHATKQIDPTGAGASHGVAASPEPTMRRVRDQRTDGRVLDAPFTS